MNAIANTESATMSNYNNEIGSKYEATKGMSRAEIAKLIRADLKAKFPEVKFSVRTENYSGGGSIDVAVKVMPEGMRLRNPNDRNPKTGLHQWMTDEAIEFEKAISAITDAYNFDHSDLQSDYFHVRFYSTVSFPREAAIASSMMD